MHRTSVGPDSSKAGRRRLRGIAALIGGAVVTAGLVIPASPVTHAATPVTINLVTVNDFHGRIENEGTGSRAAGAAALATAVKGIRADNPNTVFAAAGDLIGASTFTSFIQNDVPTIDALNAAGLEVSAVGNHEFDQGYSDLIDRVLPLANWEYIGANIETTDTAPELPEYWTVTLDGVRVGFVGAVTDELPSLVSPAGIANLTIEDPVTAANRVADQLSDGNTANGEADIVVLLVHEGAATTDLASAIDPASRFGKIVLNANANIDAIVSGHTHLAYNHVINGRPVISSGQYGEKYSNMTIVYDKDTNTITSMNNVVVDMKTPAPPTACAPPGTPCNPVYAADPAVASIVSAATAQADVLGAVKVGDVTADFNRAQQLNASENRGGESTIGNFVADVQLWAANQNGHADIAFMNPGGIRTDIKFAPDGVVTFKEAASVQPFANTLMTLDLTGAQVKTVLEQQWQPTGASRPILKLGVNKEFNYIYDPTAAAGSRILSMTLNGVPIDPAGTYRIVANSFLAAGGDNFTALAGGTNKVDTGKIDLQSMVDWLAANKVAMPDLRQRAIGVHLSAPDADGYTAGDPLTIELSSLDFSTNETKAGTVNVWLAGVSLGSFPVDPTIVNNTDEVGRATVVTTVPAGFTGLQDLALTVTSTGTTISSGFLPVAPTRLFDTRTDYPDGAVAVTKQKVGGPSKILRVKVAGVAGVPVGAAAVSLNLAVANPVGGGFVTAFPCGPTPTVASVNFTTGEVVSNAVIAPVSTAGEICFFSNVDTDLIADVNSWFPANSGFNALDPARVFDTRTDYPQGAVNVTKQKYGGLSKILKVKVTGAAGVPATGVAAVSVNLAVANPVGGGFVTAFPCGAVPTVASINFVAGEVVSNAVIAPVSASGEVCFFSNVDTDLIVDVNSWFTAGSGFHAVTPTRVFDTRADYADGAVPVTKQKVGGPSKILKVKVTGAAGVPPTGVSAVSLNLAVARSVAGGFVTVYPCGPIPTVASINYTTGQVVSNAVIAPVSPAGEVCFYSNVDTDVIVDVNSWFAT